MAILDGFFNIVHAVTSFIREMLSKLTMQYYDVILFALALTGAYYIWKSNQTVNNKWIALLLYTLIIFLTLRFV